MVAQSSQLLWLVEVCLWPVLYCFDRPESDIAVCYLCVNCSGRGENIMVVEVLTTSCSDKTNTIRRHMTTVDLKVLLLAYILSARDLLSVVDRTVTPPCFSHKGLMICMLNRSYCWCNDLLDHRILCLEMLLIWVAMLYATTTSKGTSGSLKSGVHAPACCCPIVLGVPWRLHNRYLNHFMLEQEGIRR